MLYLNNMRKKFKNYAKLLKKVNKVDNQLQEHNLVIL